ncbi:MAG: hypothetical protein MZV63_34560 [Marinilabiliales bacterium]|nr:hypothetical protein [Marinilabiliales bacterium]
MRPVRSCRCANAATATCDWEGTETVLGLYGTGTPPIVVSLVSDPVHGGSQALSLEDNSPSGTPRRTWPG